MSDHLPESSSLASILAEQGVHHQEDSESEWSAKDNPETNPITMKPKAASHVAERFSWVPLPPALCPGALSQKNLLLCQHMRLLGQFVSEC